jgi:hypothetical protein
MKDAEIIDLDDEPEATPVPWRAGSLSIVLAPLLLIAVVGSALIWNAGRSAAEQSTARVIAVTTSSAPPRGPGDVVVFTPPPGMIATRPPDAVSVGGETGDPEVLEGQRWSQLGPIHSARGDVAEAVLNGFAYVIGGSGTADDGRHVFRYDVRTGVRERAPDLPVSLDHAMAATLSDRIYVMGGYVFGRPTDRVFSLGANDANWIEHSPMLAPRAAGGAAVLHGRIWIVGGVGADSGWIRDVWAWNGSAQWSHGLALLPTPRDHLAVATYQGRVCAAGGNGGEQDFECYDPVRNEWTLMPPLRKHAVGARAAEVAGWLWVVAADTHVFTVDHWHFGPRPTAPRAGHALVEIDGALYVMEGALGSESGLRIETLRPQP